MKFKKKKRRKKCIFIVKTKNGKKIEYEREKWCTYSKIDDILCTLKHISRSTISDSMNQSNIYDYLSILILYDNLLQSCECIKTKKRIMKISWYKPSWWHLDMSIYTCTYICVSICNVCICAYAYVCLSQNEAMRF